MPGIGFRPLGYYGGGMVPKKYANGSLVEGQMYGAGTDPQPKPRDFNQFLQDEIGATAYDREFTRDAYNIPPTTGGMTGTESDRIPNPVSFGEMVFQELNPGGAGVDSGIAQHYFEQFGEYPEGFQQTDQTGVAYPNEIEKAFIAIEDSPEQVSVNDLYAFLAENGDILQNSASNTIRARVQWYMEQLANMVPGSGRVSDRDVQNTMDIAPLFNRGSGNPAGPFGDQY